MTPARLVSPRVVRMVASDANEAGFDSELHVSVPKPSVARLVATAVAVPPLDPDVLSVGLNALPMVPPTVLIPKSPNGNSSRFAFPSITAPARRMPAATRESSRGRWSSNARDPPVVGSPSTSMLSLKMIGMPCIGPRVLPAARSASSARASAIAAGFSASIECSAGPCRSNLESRARYSRTTSCVVVSPRVSASWICGAVCSTTVNRAAGAAPPVRRQLMICDRCSGVRPRRSGAATSCRAPAVTRAISAPAPGILGNAPAYGAAYFGATSASRSGTGNPPRGS